MQNNDYALHDACRKGNFKSALRLLQNTKHQINQKDAEGMTPLLYACKANSFEIIQILIKHGANLHAVNNDGLNAIYFTAKHGHRQSIKLLCSHNVDVNVTDEKQHSSLYHACISNHIYCAIHLLENGANVSNRLLNDIKKSKLRVTLIKPFYDIKKEADLILSKPTSTTNRLCFIEIIDKVEKLKINRLTLDILNLTLKYENLYFLEALINLKLPKQTFINILLNEKNTKILQYLLSLNLIIHPEPNLFSYLLEASLDTNNKEITKLLLESKYKNIVAKNIISEYCRKGAIKKLDHLIVTHNVSVNYKLSTTTHSSTPLLTTIDYKKFKLAKYLIKKGADVNKQDQYNRNAIYALMETNKTSQRTILEVLELLIKHGGNVNNIAMNNNSPLYLALERSYFKIAKFLLKHGAEVNILNTFDSNALHFACNVKHPCIKIVELIIEKGCNVNQINKNGNSPIYFSVSKRNSKLAELLLKHGAVVNKKTIERGLQTRRAQSVQQLFHKIDFCTAMLFQYVDNNVNIKEIIKIIQSGAQVTVYQKPLLFNAARVGHISFIQLLLDKYGSDPNIKDNKEETPLYIACKHGNYDLAYLLLENGAKVNLYNTKNNVTPLEISNNFDIIKMLVAHGADILRANRHYISAPSIQLALNHGFLDNAKFLLSRLHCIEYNIISSMKQYTVKFQDKSLNYLQSILNAFEQIPSMLRNKKPTNEILSFYNLHFGKRQIYYKNGYTLLHYCVVNNNYELSQILLEKYRHSPNIVDIRGNSPMHFACLNQNYYMVQLLLKYGADIYTANNKALLPIYCTKSQSIANLINLYNKGNTNLINELSSASKSKDILSKKFLYSNTVCGYSIKGKGLVYCIEMSITNLICNILEKDKIITHLMTKGHRFSNLNFFDNLHSYAIEMDNNNSVIINPNPSFVTKNSIYLNQLLINHCNDLLFFKLNPEKYTVSNDTAEKAMTFLLIQKFDNKHHRPFRGYILPKVLRMKILYLLECFELMSVTQSI